METKVKLSKDAKKGLRTAPLAVAEVFWEWVEEMEESGWDAVVEVPAFRDHLLKRERTGQRAISLNPQWRAIYRLKSGKIQVVKVLEVTPHEY